MAEKPKSFPAWAKPRNTISDNFAYVATSVDEKEDERVFCAIFYDTGTLVDSMATRYDKKITLVPIKTAWVYEVYAGSRKVADVSKVPIVRDADSPF